MELFKIVFFLASFWASFVNAGNSNTNRDQDLFWAARGKKASVVDNWQDTVLVDPFTASLFGKRDASGVPFWAARGKKYAAEPGEAITFWAARGKKDAIERREDPMPFWAARGKRMPLADLTILTEEEDEVNKREKRSPYGRDASMVHSGQRFRVRPARPAPLQAAEPFWAARGKKSSN